MRQILGVAFLIILGCSKDGGDEPVPVPLCSLEGRRTWDLRGVKIRLADPDVVVTRRRADGRPELVHAWPKNQNDFHVAMARIDSGVVLYAISDEEYAALARANEKAAPILPGR
jgi:hypothetical protein